MNVACPECTTVYRIDPARVPEGGAATRCRACDTGFRVPDLRDTAPGAVATGVRLGGEASVGHPAAGVGHDRAAATPVFGPQDPQIRARRLARALVSDIKVYNRERWVRSQDAGTVRTDFREEILKSWEEYVEQVGERMAKKTPYFRDALNDILAEGNRVF